jgi:hypothetical protein
MNLYTKRFKLNIILRIGEQISQKNFNEIANYYCKDLKAGDPGHF